MLASSPLLRIFFKMPPTIGIYCTTLPLLLLNMTRAASRPSHSKPSWAAFMQPPSSDRRSALSSSGCIWIAVRVVRINFSTGI